MSWQSLKALWQHRFVRDVATLQAGTVFSALLGVASSAVFARVLGPQTFGEYAVLTAFVALVSIPLDLGVGYATITLLSSAYGRHDRRAVVEVVAFFVKAWWFICFAIGVPVMVGAIGLAQVFYGSFRLGLLAAPLLAGQLIASLFFLITIVLQVQRRMTVLTVLENINKALLALLPVGLVIAGQGLVGVVAGQFAATIAMLIISIWLYRRLQRTDELLPRLTEVWRVRSEVRLRSHLRFSIKISLDKNISNLFYTLPVMLLGSLAPLRVAGYYKIAFSYIQLLGRLMGAISRLLQVQLPQSLVAGEKNLRVHFRKSTVWSGLASAGATIVAAAAAASLIELVYGPSYRAAALVVYVLVPFAITSGFAVGIGPVFRALDRVQNLIYTNAATLAVLTPVGYVFIARWQDIGAAILVDLYALVSTVASFILIRWHFRRLSGA